MDFLNKEAEPGVVDGNRPDVGADQFKRENIVYIENARLEAGAEQGTGKDLLGSGTGWADRCMGEILLSQGKLDVAGVNRVVDYQREKGLYFGEAAIELKLVKQDDILRALSSQFGYSYGNDEPSSKEMVMASAPFSEVAEEFRSIRAHLLNEWLSPSRKTLAIVSPGASEGRSYFAANIALAFSQLGRSTLLIDADLRSPRQNEIFSVTSRVGLSMLLAGRVRMDELDMLPDKVTAFQYLSILGSGPVPPNPSELLGNDRFAAILGKLQKYFDVIIIDTPSALYRSDVMSIASMAGSALLVTRRGYSKLTDAKSLMATLDKARARVVGAVLNQF
jgi:chain length determinant protein tyrosine kinase EpsG